MDKKLASLLIMGAVLGSGHNAVTQVQKPLNESNNHKKLRLARKKRRKQNKRNSK